ncbi:MAG: proton-conducting transporter membrane subunit, partial [Steroidobacter sp.]
MQNNLNLMFVYPELLIVAAACVLLLMELFMPAKRMVTFFVTMLTLVAAAWLTSRYGVSARTVVFNGMFVLDPMASVLKIFAYGATAISLVYSRDYLQARGLFRSEYYVLSLIALLGIMVIISAASLVTVYLGVELLSLSLYALVAFDRESGIAAESAIKYFVLGAIASGMLLYGMSMIYGVTGSL